MLTFFHTLLLTFLPLQQRRCQRQHHSPFALSLCAVLGTVLILTSHLPTSKTTQLVPDGFIPSHPFIDGASFRTNPSTDSSAPHANPSIYTPLPTTGNTCLPQVSHSQRPPLGCAPNSNGTPAHLLHPVQTLPSNHIHTNSPMMHHRPGGGVLENGWARNT